MTALTLAPAPERFSVLTIADRHPGAPVWSECLGWPMQGDNHIALDARDASRRNIWASRIDAAVLGADRAVLLVAEGLGCAAAAWWARLSPGHYADRVAGALLDLFGVALVEELVHRSIVDHVTPSAPPGDLR